MSVTKNKKGVSLVELIISVAVVFMIVAAAYALLNATQKSYATTADIAIDYLDYSLVNTYVNNVADMATGIVYGNSVTVDTSKNYLEFSVDSDGNLIITANGAATTVGKIDDGNFYVTFTKLGSNENLARVGFHFSFTADQKTYTGGTTMENMAFKNIIGFAADKETKTVDKDNVLVMYY